MNSNQYNAIKKKFVSIQVVQNVNHASQMIQNHGHVIDVNNPNIADIVGMMETVRLILQNVDTVAHKHVRIFVMINIAIDAVNVILTQV